MSKHVNLRLHYPEEVVELEIESSIHEIAVGSKLSPIADYFDVTSRLTKQLLRPEFTADDDLMGLMVIGVISAAEFYFRAILGRVVELCPVCAQHAGAATVPIGAYEHYRGTDYSYVLGSMEHESLAGSEQVKAAIKKFTGFEAGRDSSLKTALVGFGMLCELRHCLAHARGFVGSKNTRDLALKTRRLRKILMTRDSALDVLKLSHNTVRAVNRFLCNELISQWIEHDLLSGEWRQDKRLFAGLWASFSVSGEDEFDGIPQRAYRIVQTVVTKRRQGIAARVKSS